MVAARRATSACLPSGGLPAQFGGQVREPLQVLLDLLQFAQGFLLAPAVLEDTGSLFDETAAVLRTGVQDGIETALADDHMHLTADPESASNS